MGLSARQFDLSIGVANGYTLRMKKNHASIGSDILEKIARSYKHLNLTWLITGEGSMLQDKIISNEEVLLSESIREYIDEAIEKKISKALK